MSQVQQDLVVRCYHLLVEFGNTVAYYKDCCGKLKPRQCPMISSFREQVREQARADKIKVRSIVNNRDGGVLFVRLDWKPTPVDHDEILAATGVHICLLGNDRLIFATTSFCPHCGINLIPDRHLLDQ